VVESKPDHPQTTDLAVNSNRGTLLFWPTCRFNIMILVNIIKRQNAFLPETVV